MDSPGSVPLASVRPCRCWRHGCRAARAHLRLACVVWPVLFRPWHAWPMAVGQSIPSLRRTRLGQSLRFLTKSRSLDARHRRHCLWRRATIWTQTNNCLWHVRRQSVAPCCNCADVATSGLHLNTPPRFAIPWPVHCGPPVTRFPLGWQSARGQSV